MVKCGDEFRHTTPLVKKLGLNCFEKYANHAAEYCVNCC